jgi:putative GTP pyrophosphokinase
VTAYAPTPEEAAIIEALVKKYQGDIPIFATIATNLEAILDGPGLRALRHSMKSRVKDPEHLRDKLIRKLADAHKDGVPFDITEENLFERINDLVGLRILHLHTTQFGDIDRALRPILDENRYVIIDGPVARTWDDEYRAYFEGIGVATSGSSRMYTSVHYIIDLSTKTKRTAEIQVRTLAEELWGEVDHTINYPHESPKLACREQIKVLARLTSSCTRLVDSIFKTHTT